MQQNVYNTLLNVKTGEIKAIYFQVFFFLFFFFFLQMMQVLYSSLLSAFHISNVSFTMNFINFMLPNVYFS